MISGRARVSGAGVQYTKSSPWLRKHIVTGAMVFWCKTPSVIRSAIFWLPVRTAILCQNSRVRPTGTETMLRRLSEVEVRCLGGAWPLLANHVLTACDQSEIAWIAVVLPQLFGPMRTAG